MVTLPIRGVATLALLCVVLAGCDASPASATPSPVASPSPSPTEATPSGPAPTPAVLREEFDVRSAEGTAEVRVRFIDRAGIVDSVEPADPNAVEAASLAGAFGEHPAALVSIEGTADHLLLWSGLACTTTTAIVVESTATLMAISPDPVSDCDLAPVHRGVVVTFKAAATADSIRVVLDPDPLTAPLAATLAGRLTSVEFPSEWRLAVRVCPEAIVDCDLWLYPLSNGTFLADELAPGRYTVAAFMETRNGLIPLNSSNATLVAGRTTVVELVVAALPSYPAT